MIMLLEVENMKPARVCEFTEVEKALGTLKSYGPHSFASLTAQDGSYVQVAGGRVSCVLEKRTSKTSEHFRAHLEEPKVPFTGSQTLAFGGGQLQMQPDEVLFIDDVIAVFQAFYESGELPSHIKWRDMTNVLNT